MLVVKSGIAGHIAACHLLRKLSKGHEVVLSPNSNYQCIQSNIWIGIKKIKYIIFPLEPL